MRIVELVDEIDEEEEAEEAFEDLESEDEEEEEEEVDYGETEAEAAQFELDDCCNGHTAEDHDPQHGSEEHCEEGICNHDHGYGFGRGPNNALHEWRHVHGSACDHGHNHEHEHEHDDESEIIVPSSMANLSLVSMEFAGLAQPFLWKVS